ncbi:hypothetical protein, partial [Microlunatus aurantiacus]|uniref:hypothetical protein n=1 Tax=Microlunatus aurantiacus TaxID=446786 RepID=UPI0031D532C5
APAAPAPAAGRVSTCSTGGVPTADVPSDRVTDVLVVDGANVVGSRPDGWWRDRPGAAARLHRRLGATVGLADRIVLVLEGRARPGVPAGRGGPEDPRTVVEVVHATGAGDDRIVVEATAAVADGAAVTVVTADRDLARRVVEVGAAVLGPGRLLDRLVSDRDAARDRLD